jgi:uncharacterized OB-fold protein
MKLSDMEPIVKKFYEGLDKGEYWGRKCKECGAVEFPPHLACNACGYHETEWVQVSGHGYLEDFTLPGVQNDKPYLRDLGKAAGYGNKYAYGCVNIDEGSEYTYVIYGITKKNAPDILARLKAGEKVGVHAVTIQRDGWKELCFQLDEAE